MRISAALLLLFLLLFPRARADAGPAAVTRGEFGVLLCGCGGAGPRAAIRRRGVWCWGVGGAKKKHPRGRPGGAGKRILAKRQVQRIKFVQAPVSACGGSMPAARPASMQRSIQAMLWPRLRMICRPSASSATCAAFEPCTIGQ